MIRKYLKKINVKATESSLFKKKIGLKITNTERFDLVRTKPSKNEHHHLNPLKAPQNRFLLSSSKP